MASSFHLPTNDELQQLLLHFPTPLSPPSITSSHHHHPSSFLLLPSSPILLPDSPHHCLDSLLHLHELQQQPISSILPPHVLPHPFHHMGTAIIEEEKKQKSTQLSLSDFGLGPESRQNVRLKFASKTKTMQKKKAAEYHNQKDIMKNIDTIINNVVGPSVSLLHHNTNSNHDVDPKSIRRKQLTKHFYTLRLLLPNLVNGASQNDRCHLIDKTCEYIKTLERKLRILRKKAAIIDSAMKSTEKSKDGTRKMDREEMAAMDSPHVKIAYTNSGFININVGCYERNRSLFPTLLTIIEKNQFEVLSANQSRHQLATLYAIHVKIQQSSYLSKSHLHNLQRELQSEVTRLTL